MIFTCHSERSEESDFHLSACDAHPEKWVHSQVDRKRDSYECIRMFRFAQHEMSYGSCGQYVNLFYSSAIIKLFLKKGFSKRCW